MSDRTRCAFNAFWGMAVVNNMWGLVIHADKLRIIVHTAMLIMDLFFIGYNIYATGKGLNRAK